MAQSTVGVKIEASGGTIAVAELAKVRAGLSGLSGATSVATVSTDRARTSLASLALSGPRAQTALSQVAYSFERMALTGNITGEALRGLEGGLRLLTPSAGYALIGLTAVGTGFTALAAAIQGVNDKYDRHLEQLRVQGPAQTAAEKIAQLRAELARLNMMQTPRPFAQGWLWALLGGSPASFRSKGADILSTSRMLSEAEANNLANLAAGVATPSPAKAPSRGAARRTRDVLAESWRTEVQQRWESEEWFADRVRQEEADSARIRADSLRTETQQRWESETWFQEQVGELNRQASEERLALYKEEIRGRTKLEEMADEARAARLRYVESVAGKAFGASFQALTAEGGGVRAAAREILNALRAEFVARAAGEAAMAVAALASGKLASVPLHFKASAMFLAAAGTTAALGGGGGGGGGVGGASSYASNTREAIGSRGEVTIVLEGGRFLDLSDPRQLEAFRRAMEEFNGRRVVIRGG